VGLWDVVAFDEVAGIGFQDKDGVQIMKDYMASGSFARGRDAISAYASLVFIGNIDNVEVLVKTSHLLAPFPDTMIDSAFFDRFHAYIPGWEIPKMRPEFFTNRYGLITDYLAEWLREMRKRNFGDAINKYFKLGRDLNQRDTIAVRHTVSGLLKLLYPHEEYDKEAVRQCLEYAIEARRRVKEQLKKIGGMEFYDVHFSYLDQETMEERFISVLEQGGGALIPEGPLHPGVLHTVAHGSSGHLGLYRLETQITAGNGALQTSGLGSNTAAREAIKVGFDYFKANASHVSASIKPGDHNFHLHVVELHNTGPTTALTLAAFVALCSGMLSKPVQSQLVILGSMSLGGGASFRSRISLNRSKWPSTLAPSAFYSPWRVWRTFQPFLASCLPSSRPASTLTREMPCSKRWEWSNTKVVPVSSQRTFEKKTALLPPATLAKRAGCFRKTPGKAFGAKSFPKHPADVAPLACTSAMVLKTLRSAGCLANNPPGLRVYRVSHPPNAQQQGPLWGGKCFGERAETNPQNPCSHHKDLSSGQAFLRVLAVRRVGRCADAARQSDR
jgi:hypothetical protein